MKSNLYNMLNSKIIRISLILIFSFIKLCGQSQTRKVLFLGNSYTYANNLPQIVADLAASTGDVFIYDSNLVGGYTLQNHFNSQVSKNKILSNNWDYIVLQEQSQTPAFPNPATFLNGFLVLENFIKTNKPCAQISTFMTWGHQNGDIQNCPTNPSVCSFLGMNNLIKDRYLQFSDLFNAEVTPVGEVWKYIKENIPSINLYQPDGSHPSLAGSYLAACCFYTSLFRKDPTLITNNYGLDSVTASTIKNTVKGIVYNQMQNWYIGKYVPNSNFNFKIGNGNNQIEVSSNSSKYFDSISWDFGDGSFSNLILPTHSYLNDGSYTIKLTATKCYLNTISLVSVFQKTVNFCSHTNTILPNNAMVCPNETVSLYTQTADSYQWLDYLGNPIQGATNQFFQANSGEYSVITTINGCAERSPEVFVDQWIPIGEEECILKIPNQPISFQVYLYPNPTDSLLNLQTSEPILQASIINSFGVPIEVNFNQNNTIDVSKLSTGIYLLKLISKSLTTQYVKFIKK